MKKNLALMGILILTLGIVGMANAGESCKKAAASSCNKAAETKAASTDAGHCPQSAAKAAYAGALESSGCEKTAKMASAKAMGVAAFANALAEKSCSTTAAKATYAYIQDQTGCSATATAATKHAVAQAAYDKCLTKTGCEKTADATYEETSMAVAKEIEKATAEASEEESS